MTFVNITLPCKDRAEAQKIADVLLEKRLVACAKIFGPLDSTYWWKGKIEKAGEVLLVLDTHESRCPAIEELVASLHSYETFVLTALPLVYVSKNARLWLQESINMIGI
jgi:periplasmic divalent cation tolerance protein